MGRVLNLSQMIEVASQIEGHSDNVLPAFLGGFTIALLREGRIFYHQLPFLREVEMVVCIPDYTLSTEEMRKVLPSSYPRDKVVFTLSSLAYLLGSIFTGDKMCIRDRRDAIRGLKPLYFLNLVLKTDDSEE